MDRGKIGNKVIAISVREIVMRKCECERVEREKESVSERDCVCAFM